MTIRVSLSTLLVPVFLVLACAAHFGWNYFQLYKDAGAHIEVALQETDARRIKESLRSALNGMYAHNATKGHAAAFLKTARNDMARHVKSIRDAMHKAEALQASPDDSQGHDDLRGTIRELNVRHQWGSFVWGRYFWWYTAIMLLSLIVAIVIGRRRSQSRDYYNFIPPQ